MNLPSFVRHCHRLADRYHWVVLGDGTICIRDWVNADPINVVAHHIDPSFDFGDIAVAENSERARAILGMTERQFERLEDAVTGTHQGYDRWRAQILKALHLTENAR